MREGIWGALSDESSAFFPEGETSPDAEAAVSVRQVLEVLLWGPGRVEGRPWLLRCQEHLDDPKVPPLGIPPLPQVHPQRDNTK